ncbi:MAG: hypothetical protein C0606_04615 [Hyphomicrobiales bacterium]|nr:MAG: hypothetical protein C0606_04615 [Hyphomicrobiales bacterium]
MNFLLEDFPFIRVADGASDTDIVIVEGSIDVLEYFVDNKLLTDEQASRDNLNAAKAEFSNKKCTNVYDYSLDLDIFRSLIFINRDHPGDEIAGCMFAALAFYQPVYRKFFTEKLTSNRFINRVLGKDWCILRVLYNEEVTQKLDLDTIDDKLRSIVWEECFDIIK